MFPTCCRPFPVRRPQLEDDTKRVKPHIKSTPMTSSNSQVGLDPPGWLTLQRGGIQKGKEGGDVPGLQYSILSTFSQFQADQQKCVTRENAVNFSTIMTCYSLLIRLNLCTCNAPFTHARQDSLGLDEQIPNLRPLAHAAQSRGASAESRAEFQMLQIQLESGKTGI